jgi:Staphylococcal nuclease homologue
MLDVRLSNGRRDRIRVLGIDTPERGACYSAEATARTSALAGGKRVRLIGDARQPTRDRFGRRLAYVTVPGGADLGQRLLAGGFARVLVVGRRFSRYPSYVATESAVLAAMPYKQEVAGSIPAPPTFSDVAQTSGVTSVPTPGPWTRRAFRGGTP